MKTIREIVFKANGEDANVIKVQLYYNLGGMNLFTYKEEQRGYYMSVAPYTRIGRCESFTAFTGWKRCLVPVARQSKAKQAVAEKMFDEQYVMWARQCADKYGLVLEGKV